jgi:hypothetical protein
MANQTEFKSAGRLEKVLRSGRFAVKHRVHNGRDLIPFFIREAPGFFLCNQV